MLLGDPVAGRPVAAVESRPVLWAGPWGIGVRPGLGARIGRDGAVVRPEPMQGERIR